MEIKFHSPVLISQDIQTLKNFYEEVLKQEVQFDFGSCFIFKCGLSIWALEPDYTITKNLGYSYHEGGNKNLELSFETDDFEEVVQSLHKSNVKLLHDVTEENWGQLTIRLYDPENNLIEIGESMPSFVKRFANDGLSPEEIAQKTSIPLETVKEYLKSK